VVAAGRVSRMRGLAGLLVLSLLAAPAPRAEGPLFSAHQARAQDKLRQGDVDGAIADFTRAIELDPSSGLAYCNRGYARQAKGDLPGALADYHRAVALAPTSGIPYTNRGLLRHQLGDLSGGLADCERAVVLEPGTALVWYNRGVLRFQLYNRHLEDLPSFGRDDRRRRAPLTALTRADLLAATADFTRTLALDPHHYEAWVNRGIARTELGQLAEAVADLTQAISLRPGGAAQALTNRSRARLLLGDLTGALQDSDAAIAQAPDNGIAYQDRSEVRRAMGDFRGAAADLDRASQLRGAAGPTPSGAGPP
jgi:tetratricopeptide (TPR) repeat protein